VTLFAMSQTSHKVCGIILENTFTSISEMVNVIFPKLSRFKNLILRNFWPSHDRIQNLKTPMLFISGQKDELIPSDHMMELYKRATSSVFKEKFDVPDGGHNDTWFKDIEVYFEKVNGFIKKCINLYS